MAASSSSSSFNEGNLEKRLLAVNNTQDCIQTLSLWCVHHKAHYKRIIEIWFKVIKKVKLQHRLALFYLANDVIQNSKRKGWVQYVEAWKPMIKRAVPYVKDEEVRNQVERIFIIWESRSVYDAAFIKELQAVMGSSGGGGGGGIGGGHVKTKPTAVETKILTEFKPQKLVDRIHKFKKAEAEAEAKQKQFTCLKIDVCSTETLKTLKDKSHGQKFTSEFEEGTIKLEEYVDSLQRDVKERTALIEMLSQSEVYYDTQKKEVKIVGNAYKNFGSRVKNLKSKLDEFMPNLPSPIPSPSFEAPSPDDSSAEGSPNKNENKDNTEAVDMEMSDDEVDNSVSVKDNSKMDVSCFGSPPSPEGSPVGLSLSPKTKDKHSAHSATSNNKSQAKKDKKAAGPTVASILAQITKSAPKQTSTTAKSSASSLDIRLSNLMQNIPNFTSNLFGGRASFNNSGEAGSGTPVKDEESGRGSVTPLQDESRELMKDAPSGGGTPTLGDILQKLVSTGSTLNLPPQSTTSNWNSPQTQQQQHWFNQNQLSSSSSSHLPNVRQIPTPDFNRQNVAAAMFLDSNFEQNSLMNSGGGGGQFHSSLNGDRGDQHSVERQGRPNSIGYRRNSNIVELTPSPTRGGPSFDGTDHLTGSNLVPLGRKMNENVLHRNEDPLAALQRHRPVPVQAPTFPRRPLLTHGAENEVDPAFAQEPALPSLMEGSTINSNLRMIVPVGSFSNNDNERPHEHPGNRAFSKIETVGGVVRELDQTLEQWEAPSPSGGGPQGEQLYPPQGWHPLNSPQPPRREAPPYAGAYRGFRFPRRVPTPRRAVREWNPIAVTPKRPLLSPLRPRWAHNAGPPY